MPQQLRLGIKQREAIKNFFDKLEEYRIPTGDDEICERLYNNTADVVVFEEEARRYQYYAYKVVERLIKRGIFYIKIVTNPETKRKVKVLCLNRQQLQIIKNLIETKNEIKARF